MAGTGTEVVPYFKTPIYINHRWLTPYVCVFCENIYKFTVSQNSYGNAIIFVYDILYGVLMKKLVQCQVYKNNLLPR